MRFSCFFMFTLCLSLATKSVPQAIQGSMPIAAQTAQEEPQSKERKPKKERRIGSAWKQATQQVFLPSMDDKATIQQKSAPQPTPAPAPQPQPQFTPRPDPFVGRQQLTPVDPAITQQLLKDLESVLNEDDDDFDDDDGAYAMSPEEEEQFATFFMSALRGASQ